MTIDGCSNSPGQADLRTTCMYQHIDGEPMQEVTLDE